LIDPIAALRTLLLADGALVALVGTNVKGVPPGFGDSPPAVPPRSVLIQPIPSGLNTGRQTVIAPQFTLRCHGPTSVDAWKVYRATWDVFYDANGDPRPPRLVSNRWFLRSAALGQPMADLEPEGWPVVAATLACRWDSRQGEIV
jgi:hypothetical protein